MKPSSATSKLKFASAESATCTVSNKEVPPRGEDRAQECSIISFWRYDGKSFVCEHSFSTPKIVPFEHVSGKKYKKSYVMVGQSNELFFFCENKGGDQLWLCEIVNTQSHDHKSHDFDENVKKYIVENSQLLKFMKPRDFKDVSDYRFLMKKHHLTPPTLIDCGFEFGKLCVFSLFKSQDIAPSLYFYSLSQRRDVLQVAGAEALVDFATKPGQLAQGSLFFLTESTLFEAGRKKVANAFDFMQLMKFMETCDPEVIKVPIDFANYLRETAEATEPHQLVATEQLPMANNKSKIRKWRLLAPEGATRYAC